MQPILVFQTDFTYKEGAVCDIFEVNAPNFGNLWTDIPLGKFRGSFCEEYGLGFGSDWTVEFRKRGAEKV